MKETIVVVFGGTGDLMRLKIAPALFNLENIRIIGCGRSLYDDQTYFSLLNAPEKFGNKINYLQGDLNLDNFYQNLFSKISEIKKQNPSTDFQVLIYFSIMPQLFPIVIPKVKNFLQLRDQDLKLIIEKPFGLDEKSATILNTVLLENFSDQQIFRVEHYLAKDILEFIPKFRFENRQNQGMYEKYFNKNFVDSIEVTLQETLDVDKRGDFYDGVGCLRDVGQNHVLQMLSLVGCENPGNTNKNNSQAKAEFFENSLDFASVPDFKIFQYEGYKHIKGVKENSDTETAFSINTKLVGDRWKGVPVKLSAGKSCKEVDKKIQINFKENPENLENIIFDINQNKIFINSKTAGQKILDAGEKQKVQYIGEYTKLFSSAITGSRDVFVEFSEVRLMWRFIDKYLSFIEQENIKPEIYQKNTLVL